MLNIKDISYEPSFEELSTYTKNHLFIDCNNYLLQTYNALRKIEFSKDSLAMGWNVKYRKAGKSLCVLYPKQGYFTMLVVVGRKEKEKVEAVLANFSKETQQLYAQTKEGMGQRWLMVDIHKKEGLYEDLLEIVKIRRETK